MSASQVDRRASVTSHITFLVVIHLLVSRNERHSRLACTAFFGFVRLAIQSLAYFLFQHFPVPRFPVLRFLLPRFQRPLDTQHCIYMSLQKLGNEQLTHYDSEIERKACIFTFNSSAPAAQRRSPVKWLTPVKPE